MIEKEKIYIESCLLQSFSKDVNSLYLHELTNTYFYFIRLNYTAVYLTKTVRGLCFKASVLLLGDWEFSVFA